MRKLCCGVYLSRLDIHVSGEMRAIEAWRGGDCVDAKPSSPPILPFQAFLIVLSVLDLLLRGHYLNGGKCATRDPIQWEGKIRGFGAASRSQLSVLAGSTRRTPCEPALSPLIDPHIMHYCCDYPSLLCSVWSHLFLDSCYLIVASIFLEAPRIHRCSQLHQCN